MSDSAANKTNRVHDATDRRVPTSVVLRGLLTHAPADVVTLDWIVDQLRERSFGVVLLLVALVALVPGASPVAGILLAAIAVQMIRDRPRPIIPRFVASRHLSTARLAVLIGRLASVLKRIETIIRPRWPTPFEATKRVIGAVILLLGVSLLTPIPFSHVIPALVIMLLAFAFLEGDGLLLSIALAAAVLSLCVTAAAIWGTVEAGLAI